MLYFKLLFFVLIDIHFVSMSLDHNGEHDFLALHIMLKLYPYKDTTYHFFLSFHYLRAISLKHSKRQ